MEGESQVMDELTEQTAPDVAVTESKPKRTRRPRTVKPEQIDVDIPTIPDAAPRRTRRAAKLKGDDVAAMVQHASVLVAMLMQQEHWVIPADEVKPWSGDAAELLNRVPAKYVAAAANASGFATVAIGIYSTLKPRIDYSQKLNAEQRAKRAAMREQAEADQASAGSLAGEGVPWAG